jgi:hypothetical protein
MSKDYLAITVVVLLAIVLVIILIRRNQKDLKDFKQTLNKDYHHPTPSEHDEDTDDIKSA